MQNLVVAVCHTVWAYVVDLKKWGTGAPPLWNRGVSDLETRPSQLCYHAEFGRCRSDGSSVRTYGDLSEKNIRTSRVRSLKVIGTDMD